MTMRSAFHPPSGCSAISVDPDIIPLSFPFCDTAPSFTTPTLVVREPDLFIPDLAPPDLCHCITFGCSGATARVFPVGLQPHIKLGIARNTSATNCCEQDFDVRLSMDIPCLPLTIRASGITAYIDMNVASPQVDLRFKKSDNIPSGGVSCAFDCEFSLAIDCQLKNVHVNVQGDPGNLLLTAYFSQHSGTAGCDFDLNLAFNDISFPPFPPFPPFPCQLDGLQVSGSGSLIKSFKITNPCSHLSYIISHPGADSHISYIRSNCCEAVIKLVLTHPNDLQYLEIRAGDPASIAPKAGTPPARNYVIDVSCQLAHLAVSGKGYGNILYKRFAYSSANCSGKIFLDLSVAAVGSRGPTGPKGATGDQGVQGFQGVQGLKGTKGDTGSFGAGGMYVDVLVDVQFAGGVFQKKSQHVKVIAADPVGAWTDIVGGTAETCPVP